LTVSTVETGRDNGTDTYVYNNINGMQRYGMVQHSAYSIT